MMRRLAERPGWVFGFVFAWKVALLIFTAQPVPANDSFFYDGPVVNFLLHGKYANPSLALVLPISGNEVFSAYPPLYQLVLLGWMSMFGTSALSAMWLHILLFGLYELIVLAIFRRLQTPAMCVNLAGLFLLSITFHDRPDSLAHVLGMAAVYACVRSRRSLGGGTGEMNEPLARTLPINLPPADPPLTPTAIELASRPRKRNTLKRGHQTGFRAFGVHALACLGLNSMAVPLTPPRRGAAHDGLFPSWEGLGVGSGAHRSAVEAKPNSHWAWVAAGLTVLTLGTSLQIGAFYLLFAWLVMLASSLLARETFPVAPMVASVLIPIGLVALVALGFPHLWLGFLEHARLTPSATGLRMPQATAILKVIRTVPGVLAISLLLSWLMARRNGHEPSGAARFWLVTGPCTATALAVVVASLFVVTANMVQIANYLQPLAVGGCLALVMTRIPRPSLPRRHLAVFLGLAFIVSIRAIGMTTWGLACATDMSYTTMLRRLRAELKTTAPGSTVIVSAAYLYETARHDELQWIHSDWPGKTDYSRGDWERDALVALKPAKLIITQFDYYRRYEAVLADLKTRPKLLEFQIHNTAKMPAPDSIRPLQRVVQHLSWAPVVVDFSWRQPREKP